MEKIDFFGGTHGNFLELIINLFIYQTQFDENKLFSNNGACHLKHTNKNYIPKIKCNHYSYNNIPFDHTDRVIEIRCTINDMLPAITNSFTRAGDQTIDITNLEIGTIDKLFQLPKAKFLLQDIINAHGVKENYPRSVIRNYFYSKFSIPEYGVDMFNSFNYTGPTFHFLFEAFFNLEKLYVALNDCATFLNMNFYPTARTVDIWKEFIKVNQGYHSQLKCNQAIHCILTGQPMYIGDCNLIEEAWILYQLSRIFRCYDHPLLNTDQFINNTEELSKIIYHWKKGDY